MSSQRQRLILWRKKDDQDKVVRRMVEEEVARLTLKSKDKEVNNYPLSWRRTRFKLIAYLSNLLGSNNVRLMQLGESLKTMLWTD